MIVGDADGWIPALTRHGAAEVRRASFWGLVVTLTALGAGATALLRLVGPASLRDGALPQGAGFIVYAVVVTILMWFPMGYGRERRDFGVLLGGYLGGLLLKLVALGAVFAGAFGISPDEEYAVACAYVGACFATLLVETVWLRGRAG